MIELSTPIKELTRVGRATERQMARLGIETVQDLIFYFPKRYEDLTALKKIDQLMVGETATIRARLEQIKSFRSPRKRKIITEALVSDETGKLRIVWFNQGYLTKTLKPGAFYYFSGKIDDRYHFEMTAPIYELAHTHGEQLHTNRIVPIYKLTEGISQKQLRWLIKLSLSAVESVEEWLPDFVINNEDFPDVGRGVKEIHFPKNIDIAQNALNRFKFGELFLLQLVAAKNRQSLTTLPAPSIKLKPEILNNSFSQIPFELTDDQRTSLQEILIDLSGEHPMNRLLEGDVGSGKTIVTALVIEQAIANGYQVVMMAPTSILARQHFDSFILFFNGKNKKIGLLTRTEKKINDINVSQKEFKDALAVGEINLVIGTHALLEEKINFKDLGLAVIDEQHRFGVKQRQALREKNQGDYWPHLLSLTATPIPRTLALTLYGDLHLSIIQSMPLGRKPVKTDVVKESSRANAYQFIKKELQQGRQGFVVCPLIEESDKLGVKSVKQEFEKLREIFPTLQIEFIHGKMKPTEKDEVMANFRDKKIHLLVSTTVIEVGINIPNANIMIIEGADRFGLAQLHQLRGRVGRSTDQGYCFLFTESVNEKTLERLNIFQGSTNGFDLAEADLQIRGPGDIYGWEQSGFPKLKYASFNDKKLIKKAQQYAEQVFGEYGLEKLPNLERRLERFERSIHFE